MPDDAKALVHLGQSIVMVSFPVEVWKQPRVLDSGAHTSTRQGAGGLSVLTLKAAGLLDVDAGEIVRPGSCASTAIRSSPSEVSPRATSSISATPSCFPA
jgi:hypothetical protein